METVIRIRWSLAVMTLRDMLDRAILGEAEGLSLTARQ
jgi:hypothetical protein